MKGTVERDLSESFKPKQWVWVENVCFLNIQWYSVKKQIYHILIYCQFERQITVVLICGKQQRPVQ